jgi:hypothetical protein
MQSSTTTRKWFQEVKNGLKLNSPSKLQQIGAIVVQSILGITSLVKDGFKFHDNTHQSKCISCPHPLNKHF